MKISVDVVNDTASDTNFYAEPNTANWTKEVASIYVNPYNKPIGEDEIGLRYDYFDHGNGQELIEGWGNTLDSSGVLDKMYGLANVFRASKKTSEVEEEQGNPYKNIEIDIDYDDNVSVGTSGANLQIRFEPIIKPNQEIWSQYEQSSYENLPDDFCYELHSYVYGGIYSEAWRIDGIRMKSYNSDTGASVDDAFQNINSTDIQVNVDFETPSEGEADGWNDEWGLALTRVDDNGLESALSDKDVTFANTDVTKSPSLAVIVDSANSQFLNSSLIKGYMKSKRNPTYNHQFTIDCKNKIIMSSTTSKKIEASTFNNITQYFLSSRYLLVPNEIDSYESQTGVLIDNALNPNKMRASFKTDVIPKKI